LWIRDQSGYQQPTIINTLTALWDQAPTHIYVLFIYVHSSCFSFHVIIIRYLFLPKTTVIYKFYALYWYLIVIVYYISIK
jgi:hypothetical protein